MPITSFQYQQMLARTSAARREFQKPEKAVRRESDLHDDVIEECRRRSWIPIYSRMDRKTSNPLGTPDFIIATDDGRTLYLEAKSRTGKLSTAQRAALAWLKKNKQITGVIGSMADFYAIADQTKTHLEKP